MFTFNQPVFQIGGGTSEGTLMRASSDPKRIEIRQYFERHGFDDVIFETPADFCEFLETSFYKDDRLVFFEEQSDSRNYKILTTSPHKEYKKEIFLTGILKSIKN